MRKHSIDTALFNNASQDLISDVTTGCHVYPMCHRDTQHLLRQFNALYMTVKEASHSYKDIDHAYPENRRHKANHEQQDTIYDDRRPPLRYAVLSAAFLIDLREQNLHTSMLLCLVHRRLHQNMLQFRATYELVHVLN